jgi:Icc-related predicted phosphoesterase
VKLKTMATRQELEKRITFLTTKLIDVTKITTQLTKELMELKKNHRILDLQVNFCVKEQIESLINNRILNTISNNDLQTRMRNIENKRKENKYDCS